GLRIAHLDTGRSWRGGQRQALLLMRGLRERGVASLLLAPEGPLLLRAREERFDGLPWSGFAEWDPFAMLHAYRALRRWRPTLIHAHTARSHTLAAPAARMLRVPLVVSRRVVSEVRRNPASLLKYRKGA